MVLRVVFADDNLLVREGVAALLAEVEGILLVDALVDSESLIESVAKHRPDVALTDIRMPPSFTNEGIEAAKRIRAEHQLVQLGHTLLQEIPQAAYSVGQQFKGVVLLDVLRQDEDAG